mmetsp:Transcript_52443/g.125304  ORF Transcript_52443/g.125304 Transcript_52443/m.125304 type:complete len:692 (-) Transcript_52443:235-2310(-)
MPFRSHSLFLVLASTLLYAASASESFRNSLLELAHDRLEVQYADKGSLDDPKERDAVKYQLSKDDKACGDDGVPIMYLDFEIEGARPVDAFNVLADALSQPTWDSACAQVEPLVEMRNLQARGLAATFLAKPLSSREAFEWQVLSANVTLQEFWVVYTTEGNDDLKARRSLDPDAVEMQNCLGAYYLRPSANGVHVLGTQQVNSHSSPLSARTVANMAWGQTIDWAVAFRKASQKQAALHWNDTKTSVPSWMYTDQPCSAAEAEDHVRTGLLERAEAEFQIPQRGKEHSTSALPDGTVLQMWSRDGSCGGKGVPRASLPVWQTEFCIDATDPVDVFNVLIAKSEEPSWNSVVKHVNFTGMHAGARGTHEAIAMPPVLWHRWRTRELFEWQAAGHTLENDTYVIALASTEQRIAEMFDSANVKAFQCLAAYQLSVGRDCNGTQVRTTQHVNPNIAIASGVAKLWPKAGTQLMTEFASSVMSQAQQLAKQRRAGGAVEIDWEALALLAPARPGRNSTLDLRTVLASPPQSLLEAFSRLELPQVLDLSGASLEDFRRSAEEVLKLFHKLQHNASEVEAEVFANGAARNAIDLQLQGEALARIQSRVLDKLSCGAGPHLPDINRHKTPKGMPLKLLATLLGAAALVLLVTAAGCAWCGVRRCRRNRAMRQRRSTPPARTARVALLHEDPAPQGAA